VQKWWSPGTINNRNNVTSITMVTACVVQFLVLFYFWPTITCMLFPSVWSRVCQEILARKNLPCCLMGCQYTTNSIRTSARAIVFSATEHGARVRFRSSKKLVVALNDTPHLITGSLRPTPTTLLPTLAGTTKALMTSCNEHPLYGSI